MYFPMSMSPRTFSTEGWRPQAGLRQQVGLCFFNIGRVANEVGQKRQDSGPPNNPRSGVHHEELDGNRLVMTSANRLRNSYRHGMAPLPAL